MKKDDRIFKIYLYVLGAAAFTAALLRTIASVIWLNESTALFSNSAMITVANIIVIASVVFFASYPSVGRRMNPGKSFSASKAFIPSGILAVALLFMSASSALLLKGELTVSSGAGAQKGELLLSLSLILVAILAAVSGFGMFYSVLTEKRESERAALFSMLTAAFLAVYAIYLYFNPTFSINAPAKITDELAYLSAALFFLFETRINLGRAKWRAYVSFGLISAMLCIYSSIPSLMYYIIKNGSMLSISFAETVLTLSLAAYIICRLVCLLNSPDDEKGDSAEALTAISKAREESVKLDEEEFARAYDNMVENSSDEYIEDAENYTIDIPETITQQESENSGE